jgi:hypothetical protein
VYVPVHVHVCICLCLCVWDERGGRQLVFSRDDRWLLSVSRDRSFCLFERTGEAAAAAGPYVVTLCVRVRERTTDAGSEGGGYSYALRAQVAKAHARIVWSGAFVPDNTAVLTASRDQTLKVWAVPSAQPLAQLQLGESVTAVDVAPVGLPDGYRRPTSHPSTPYTHAVCMYVLVHVHVRVGGGCRRWLAALGLESGAVVLVAGRAGGAWVELHRWPDRYGHALSS